VEERGKGERCLQALIWMPAHAGHWPMISIKFFEYPAADANRIPTEP